MKIALTLTRTQAKVLASTTFIDCPIFLTREQRVYYSLMSEVSVKATRLYLGFGNKKERKITLKLYEADFLEQYLTEVLSLRYTYLDTYETSTLQTIINDINEQLA